MLSGPLCNYYYGPILLGKFAAFTFPNDHDLMYHFRGFRILRTSQSVKIHPCDVLRRKVVVRKGVILDRGFILVWAVSVGRIADLY